jgi:hypothetical protein
MRRRHGRRGPRKSLAGYRLGWGIDGMERDGMGPKEEVDPEITPT